MDSPSTLSQIADAEKEILALSKLYQLASHKKEHAELRLKILSQMQELQKKVKELKDSLKM